MEKDPARRYQSAGEMMQHCQQVFAELAASPVPIHQQMTQVPQAPYGYAQMPHGTPAGYPAQQPPPQPQQPPMQQPSQAALAYQSSPLQYPQYQPPAHVPTPREPTPVARPARAPAPPAAASTVFWIVSLVLGVALGVVAYVLVVQLS